jgi:hypothetical protein
MTSYNKRRRERDFREGAEERARASEEARRAGWVSRQHEKYGLLAWTHPERPGLEYLGNAVNIPEEYRRA